MKITSRTQDYCLSVHEHEPRVIEKQQESSLEQMTHVTWSQDVLVWGEPQCLDSRKRYVRFSSLDCYGAPAVWAMLMVKCWVRFSVTFFRTWQLSFCVLLWWWTLDVLVRIISTLSRDEQRRLKIKSAPIQFCFEKKPTFGTSELHFPFTFICFTFIIIRATQITFHRRLCSCQKFNFYALFHFGMKWDHNTQTHFGLGLQFTIIQIIA